MNIFALSDPHGALDKLEEVFLMLIKENLDNSKNDILVLCGDYTDRYDRRMDILYYIKELQEQYPKQIVVLKGNHEDMLIQYIFSNYISADEVEFMHWLRDLPEFYETKKQIYVHAGINEKDTKKWRKTSKNLFYNKFPPTVGTKFIKDIIAGHVTTSSITGDDNYHKVYYDGYSHFYIDGNTEETGIIPVLKYNVEADKYTSFEEVIDDGNLKYIEYTVK